MPDRFSPVTQGTNLFAASGLAMSMYGPFLIGAMRGNIQGQEGFVRLAGEWQDFVARRLKEDFALMDRVAHGHTPDQILAAYADFWATAAEDYGRELTSMAKLMAQVTTKMVAATQSVVEHGETPGVPSRKAA